MDYNVTARCINYKKSTQPIQNHVNSRKKKKAIRANKYIIAREVIESRTRKVEVSYAATISKQLTKLIKLYQLKLNYLKKPVANQSK